MAPINLLTFGDLVPDYSQAYSFIAAIAGDPDKAIIDFRAIHDQRKDIPALPRRGTLPMLWAELVQFNQSGYGIFANIAALDGDGRKYTNVQQIRAHYVDLDNQSAVQNYHRTQQFVIPPSFAVCSSPDKYHVYWPVQPYNDNQRFATVQQKLIQLFDSDAGIWDATRVMRLPGTLHQKGAPYSVTCHALNGYGQQYQLEHFEQALASVQVLSVSEVRHTLGDEKMTAPSLDWVMRVMELTDPNMMSYQDWLSFSCAFKQSAWLHGDEKQLYDIWSRWCSQHATNDEGENLKLWNSIIDTQVGWANLAKRLPSVYLPDPASLKAPAASAELAVSATPPMPAPPPLDCSGEILTFLEQREWFKGCYLIERMGEILTPTGRYMGSTKFNAAYGGKQFMINSSGRPTDEPWKAATRSTLGTIPKVDHVRFLPDLPQGEIVIDQLGRKGVNTYIPIIIQRMAGDVTPFLRHLELMLPDANDRKIILDYFAHNIRYPGYKIPWAPLIQSTEGVGKGFIQVLIENIIGKMYCYSPKAQELVESGSKFNAWMRAKLFIIVNEIRVNEKKDLIDILKPMIADSSVEIQAKGIDQEMEDNVSNWLFFSNFKDAMPVNKNGRRFSIFYSAIQSKQDLIDRNMTDAYFSWLFNWMKEGGHKIVADYFLTYPIERGSIPMTAPETSSTAEARFISRTPIQRMVDDCIADNVVGFRGGYLSLLSVERRMKDMGLRRLSHNFLEQVITEEMGYTSLGRAPQVYLLESENNRESRTILFHQNPQARVEDFAAWQGW